MNSIIDLLIFIYNFIWFKYLSLLMFDDIFDGKILEIVKETLLLRIN